MSMNWDEVEKAIEAALQQRGLTGNVRELVNAAQAVSTTHFTSGEVRHGVLRLLDANRVVVTDDRKFKLADAALAK